MKFCVLMGSPNKNGNIAELCNPFIDELKTNGAKAAILAKTRRMNTSVYRRMMFLMF